MSIWQKILQLLGKRRKFGPRTYEINESLQVTLSTLAEHEGRSEQELLPDILAVGLDRYQSTEKLWVKWETLTPREQNVAALTCLGLTNREISARLFLSPETIKTHVRNVLFKFGVKKKTELRRILAGWDFSAWM